MPDYRITIDGQVYKISSPDELSQDELMQAASHIATQHPAKPPPLSNAGFGSQNEGTHGTGYGQAAPHPHDYGPATTSNPGYGSQNEGLRDPFAKATASGSVLSVAKKTLTPADINTAIQGSGHPAIPKENPNDSYDPTNPNYLSTLARNAPKFNAQSLATQAAWNKKNNVPATIGENLAKTQRAIEQFLQPVAGLIDNSAVGNAPGGTGAGAGTAITKQVLAPVLNTPMNVMAHANRVLTGQNFDQSVADKGNASLLERGVESPLRLWMDLGLPGAGKLVGAALDPVVQALSKGKAVVPPVGEAIPALKVVDGGKPALADELANIVTTGKKAGPPPSETYIKPGSMQGVMNSTGRATTDANYAHDFQASLDQIAAKKAGKPAAPTEPPVPIDAPVEAPQGPVRNFRAGLNNGQMQFDSQLHQDLYDIGSIENQSMRDSGNLAKNSGPNIVRQKNLIASVSEQLGMTEQEVRDLARQTYKEGKAQMKGVQDGETRTITPPDAVNTLGKLYGEDKPFTPLAESDPFAALAEPKADVPTPGSQADIQAQIAAKRAEIAAKAKGMGSKNRGATSLPGDIADAIELGALHLKSGLVGAKEWGQQMIADLGEQIRPQLQAIWDHIQQGYDHTDPFTAMPKGKPTAEDIAQTALDYHRFNMLSGPGIVGKMGASAVQNALTTPVEDLIGAGIGKLAPGLAEAAPWEAAGARGVKNSVKALGDLFSKNPEFQKGSLADALDMLKTGQNELGSKYGTSFAGDEFGAPGLSSKDQVLGFFGRLHGAAMTLIQRTAFIRSLANRVDALGAGATEAQLETAGKGAFGDSLQAIFRNDNKMTDAIKAGMDGVDTALGTKVPTIIARNAIPFAGVGTNVAGRMAEYSGAAALKEGGAALYSKIFQGGVKTMAPEEAAAVMRAYKRAGVGGALFAAGYAAPKVIDSLPNAVKHNPAVQVATFGAMARESHDRRQPISSTLNKIKAQSLQNLPIGSAVTNLAKISSPNDTEAGKAMGQELDSWIPLSGALGYVARTLDKRGGPSLTGDTVKRSPKGATQEVKSDLPILRGQVPLARAPKGPSSKVPGIPAWITSGKGPPGPRLPK